MEFKNIAGQIAEVAKNYDYHEPPGILVKLQEMMTAIARAIRDLLNLIQLPQTGSSDTKMVGNLLQILLALAAVVAVVVVAFLVIRRVKHLQAQKQMTLGEMIDGERALNAKGWRNLAEELSQTGSLREACRAIYMSCLHHLDESSIAVFAPTKTNYEYFYALKQQTLIAQNFRTLVDLVELIWFGGKTATAADYRQCLSLLNRIEEEAAQFVQNKNQMSGAKR